MTSDRSAAARHAAIAKFGLLAGPLSFFFILLMPPAGGASQEAWFVAAIASLMAIWWVTEALPLAATALIPAMLFPVMDLLPFEEVSAAYANPIILLFLGGFLIARAMQRWRLHSFLARFLASRGSGGPRSLVAAVMAATAFLSMWISNTAAALVMLPIGQSIIASYRNGKAVAVRGADQFAPALMLSIAFSATIGGMTTLIGTPPNAIFVAFLRSSYGIEVGFGQWMLLGVPIALMLLPVTWILLTRLAFRVDGRSDALGERDMSNSPDPENLSGEARVVATVMAMAALALIFRPLIQNAVPFFSLSDAGIFLFAALVLFAWPAGGETGGRLLNLEDLISIRWDVLILVGGGLALASAIDRSGLSRWIGSALSAFDILPVFMLILLVMVLMVYLGELASNTAMAAVFLPIAGATAIGMGLDPLTLVLPVALAASLGFMLPVATPPNAIVYGSGEVSNAQMIKAGSILDILAILVVYAIAVLLGPYVIKA